MQNVASIFSAKALVTTPSGRAAVQPDARMLGQFASLLFLAETSPNL